MTKVRYLIFYVDKGRSINDRCLEAVEQEVKDRGGEHLYLIIQTYGGNPFSAVSIMNILQSKFPHISTLIPKYAKSAGTLMALGTDIIYMNARSALGPLDLPIEHPKDGSRISALDLRNAITELSELCNLIALERYKLLRDEEGKNDIGVSKIDAAKLAFESAVEFTRPIIDKVDPYHLNKSMRELRIARDYAIDLLMSRMMKGDFNKALTTATRFVNIFPVHEYSIFSKEAGGLLGLTIGDLESLSEWQGIKMEIESACMGKDFFISYREKDFLLPAPRPFQPPPVVRASSQEVQESAQ